MQKVYRLFQPPQKNNQVLFYTVILLQLILIHHFPSSHLPPQALFLHHVRQEYLSGGILRYFVGSMECSPFQSSLKRLYWSESTRLWDSDK